MVGYNKSKNKSYPCYTRSIHIKFAQIGAYAFLPSCSFVPESSPRVGRLFPNKVLGESPARLGEDSATHWEDMGSIYDTPPRRYSLTIFWIKNLQLILRLTAKCVLCIWNHTSVKDFVMAHTISAVYLHVIFSCKDHRPFIQPDWKDELYHYMGGILKNIGVQPIRIGGSTDHVHTLCSVGTESAISSIVRTLKAGSSTWVKS